MKLLFILIFTIQGSSWKVKNVSKQDNIYEVQLYKKDTINNISGITYKVYYTDVIKCPEKLY